MLMNISWLAHDANGASLLALAKSKYINYIIKVMSPARGFSAFTYKPFVAPFLPSAISLSSSQITGALWRDLHLSTLSV